MSSSIPSWQILTAHAQPFRGVRNLAFFLKDPLDSLLLWASSEGSGETARMRRLAWTFAARIGDKYQIRLTRSIMPKAFVKIVLTVADENGCFIVSDHYCSCNGKLATAVINTKLLDKEVDSTKKYIESSPWRNCSGWGTMIVCLKTPFLYCVYTFAGTSNWLVRKCRALTNTRRSANKNLKK